MTSKLYATTLAIALSASGSGCHKTAPSSLATSHADPGGHYSEVVFYNRDKRSQLLDGFCDRFADPATLKNGSSFDLIGDSIVPVPGKVGKNEFMLRYRPSYSVDRGNETMLHNEDAEIWNNTPGRESWTTKRAVIVACNKPSRNPETNAMVFFSKWSKESGQWRFSEEGFDVLTVRMFKNDH